MINQLRGQNTLPTANKIMSEKKTSFKVREEVSSYRNDNNWRDDITESFPRNVTCPVCRNGKFELSVQGALVNGVCSNCETSVPYQFYDTRYLYLDSIADAVNNYEANQKEIRRLEADAENNKLWFNEFSRIEDATFDLWENDIHESDGTQTVLDGIQKLRDKNERLEAREKELIEALTNIANPIQYFQKEAEKRGAVVDDVAADSLSNDANFLKSLAKKAIEKENK